MKAILKIKGMSCSHCANRVTEILMEESNIERADVDLSNEIATVIFDGEIDEKELKNKIKEAGYRLKKISFEKNN